MLETAVGLQHDPKWRRLMLEKPEIWGIESISAEAVVVRLVVKTRSGSKDDVARELRMRLKRALDELGVRLPRAELDHAQRTRGRGVGARRPPAEDRPGAGAGSGREGGRSRSRRRAPRDPRDDEDPQPRDRRTRRERL